MIRKTGRKRPGDVYLDAAKTGKLPHSDIPLPKMMTLKAKGREEETPRPSTRAMDSTRPGRTGTQKPTPPVLDRQARLFRFDASGRLAVESTPPSVPERGRRGRGHGQGVSDQKAPELAGKPAGGRQRVHRASGTSEGVSLVSEPLMTPGNLRRSGKNLANPVRYSAPAAGGGTDGETHPLGSATPLGGEGELCPLLSAPCIGPDCRWWDRVSDCSVSSSLRLQSEIVGRVNSLIALIEYVSTRA